MTNATSRNYTVITTDDDCGFVYICKSMVRRHLNPEVVWKSDRVHLSGLAVTVGYAKSDMESTAYDR